MVGAGPAGVASALFLSQRGHDVLLLDKLVFPRDKLCGESVSPEAWRLLEALDLADAVRRLAPQPISGMALFAPDGTRFNGRYPGERQGFAVRRLALDAALLAVARERGIEVREGESVDDLVIEGGVTRGVRVRNSGGGREIRSRLVVAADGRHSTVARRLGLWRKHRSLHRFAVRGHWEGVHGLTDYGEMHVGRGAYCGVAPLSAGTANIAFVVDRSEIAGAATDVTGFYRRTLRRWPELCERLESATLVAPPRAIGPLAVEPLHASAPGVALVGDAAGFYDPFTGEGITLALRSAELLAPIAAAALRAGRSERLSEYEAARDQATRAKFRLNRLLQRLIAWPQLADSVARKLAHRPDLADRLVGIAGDLVPAESALGPRFLWDLLTA